MLFRSLTRELNEQHDRAKESMQRLEDSNAYYRLLPTLQSYCTGAGDPWYDYELNYIIQHQQTDTGPAGVSEAEATSP